MAQPVVPEGLSKVLPIWAEKGLRPEAAQELRGEPVTLPLADGPVALPEPQARRAFRRQEQPQDAQLAQAELAPQPEAGAQKVPPTLTAWPPEVLPSVSAQPAAQPGATVLRRQLLSSA